MNEDEKKLKKDLVECLKSVDSEIEALDKEIKFCQQHKFLMEARFKEMRINGMVDVYVKINNDVLGRFF